MIEEKVPSLFGFESLAQESLGRFFHPVSGWRYCPGLDSWTAGSLYHRGEFDVGGVSDNPQKQVHSAMFKRKRGL